MLGSESLRLKAELKATYGILNKSKEPLIKYNLFSKLAALYLSQEDVREYGNAVAIYQYLHKLIKQYPEVVNEEINDEALDRSVALIIEKFVGKVTQQQISVDYGDKSLERVKSYKKYLEDYRKEIKRKLQLIENLGIKEGQEELDENELQKRAEEVEKIYEDISNFFIGEQGLVKQLLNECIEELGGVPKIKRDNKERPCEYAAFGMGSMSLGTMTPWSDIEFGILIEEGLADDEKRVKDFFRNVTLLLNIKILNFGETVLHYQGIKELNDFSTGGRGNFEDWFVDDLPPKSFCFDAMLPDGCKTPLGRKGCYGYEDYELIRTPTEMLKFQQESKWQEKDIPLVQALWHIVLIIGSSRLLENYQQGLNKELIKQRSFIILKEDSEKIDPIKQISDHNKEGHMLDVKREIYRFPDRIITALGDCLEETGNSTWDVVAKLGQQGKVTPADAKNLQIALGIAAEIRIRAYASNNGKTDNMAILARYELRAKEFKEIESLEKVFYLNDSKMLYRYYYTALALVFIIKKTERIEVLPRQFEKVLLFINEPFIKGYIHKRFLKYYAAIEEFEKVRDFNGRITLGNLYQVIGRHEEALRCFQESLEIRRRIYKGDHVDIATPLNNIGVALQSLGRCQEALKYNQESLEMRRRIYKGDHADIADSLNNVGITFESLERYEETLKYIQESLEMRRRIYKGDHADMAASLNNVGATLQILKRYEEALECFRESLEMKHRIYKGDHADIAISLNNKGGTLENIGRYGEALKFYQESLEMRRRIYKGDHADIVASLNDVGNTLESLKRYEEALIFYQEGLEMKRRIHKGDHVDIAIFLSSIGIILHSLGRCEEALEYNQESLEMRRRIYKGDHAVIAASLHNTGSTLEKLGRYEEALEYNQKSFEMRRKIYKGLHVDIAASLYNMGNILRSLGRYEEALKYIIEAIKIYEKTMPANHPIFQITQQQFKNCLILLANQEVLLGNFEKAVGSYAKLGIGIEIDGFAALTYDLANQSWQAGELTVTISCYETLSIRLMPLDRTVKHNLGCAYHVKAIEEKNKNRVKEFQLYLSKAREAFEVAIGLNMESSATTSTYVEYAMFLLKNHNIKNIGEYKKIEKLLLKAIELGDDKSSLSYCKVDSNIIVEVLQNLLNKQEKISINRPYLLAYYLLIKTYFIHEERETTQHELEVLITIIPTLEDNDKAMVDHLINCLSKEYNLHHVPSGYEPNIIENQYTAMLLGLVTSLPFRAYLRNDKSYIVDAIYQRQDIEKPEDYVQAIRAQYNLPFVLGNSEGGYKIILNGVNISQISNLIMERFKSKNEGARTIN